MCENIERLWKCGRTSLRYFYRDSSQVGLDDSGHPTHDVGIKTSFGTPLKVDQASTDRTIVRVTTAITLDNVYKHMFSLGSERLSREEYFKSMFGLTETVKAKNRIPEKECKKYLSCLFTKCLYFEEECEEHKFDAWLAATTSQKVVGRSILDGLCADERLASILYNRICQTTQPMGACFASNIDSHNRVQDVVEVFQKVGLQEKGRDDVIIFLNDGEETAVSSGYRLIVYGDHGPYIELERDKISWESFPISNKNRNSFITMRDSLKIGSICCIYKSAPYETSLILRKHQESPASGTTGWKVMRTTYQECATYQH